MCMMITIIRRSPRYLTLVNVPAYTQGKSLNLYNACSYWDFCFSYLGTFQYWKMVHFEVSMCRFTGPCILKILFKCVHSISKSAESWYNCSHQCTLFIAVHILQLICLFVYIILTSPFSICRLYQCILGETEACWLGTMTYSYGRRLGIFYIHYNIDTITHDMAFDEPVGSTGWSKLVT